MYERFAGGGYMSGIKIVRGYAEPGKDKDGNDLAPPAQSGPGLDERQQKLLKRRSAPPTTSRPDEPNVKVQTPGVESETQHARLQRQISSLVEREKRSTGEAEEEIRQQEEQEIRDDYNAETGETQSRDIEHLVLVTHGIGQLLSLRYAPSPANRSAIPILTISSPRSMDSINFVHDVNVLRKMLKSVYARSADLRALNAELGAESCNSRVQVLPVCWRHLLNFPRQRDRRSEHDLGDMDNQDDDCKLPQITVTEAGQLT